MFLKCHVTISEPVGAVPCFFAGGVCGALGVVTALEMGDNLMPPDTTSVLLCIIREVFKNPSHGKSR